VYKYRGKDAQGTAKFATLSLKPMEEKAQEIQERPESGPVKRIMVMGNHDYIVKNAETLLQRAGYETTGYTEAEEALDYIRYNPLDAVLIGGGVDPHVRMKITSLVSVEFPHIKVVEHFGGPATILTEVIAVIG